MAYPIISADSHVTEAPDTYTAYCDPDFRDRAPSFAEVDGNVGFHIEGMNHVQIGRAAGAGVPPEERMRIKTLEDLHRGGWDSAYRLKDQDIDGVAAEVIYPTLGLVLCNHPDMAYKEKSFAAYNRWLADYCAVSPERLLGVGQTALSTPEQGIADLKAIKAAGLRGVLLPGMPGMEDYDSAIYDPLWQAAVDLDLPLSFHIIGAPGQRAKIRGDKVNGFVVTLRGLQDIVGLLIFGGVFERHPDLKIVCVEGDAGWIAHWAHRLNRAFIEHRHHLGGRNLQKLPSEYMFENLYFTFQDDPVAFRMAHAVNWKRLMWSNDFPHSDSTWPNSQKLLDEHTKPVTAEQKQAILSGNVAELYAMDLGKVAA